MKFSNSIFGLALATTALGAPAPVPAILSSNSAQQPASSYPIGNGGANAKVAGRLFDIDGHVEYFAGIIPYFSLKVLCLPFLGSNAWWLALLSENSDVDKTLSEVSNVSSVT